MVIEEREHIRRLLEAGSGELPSLGGGFENYPLRIYPEPASGERMRMRWCQTQRGQQFLPPICRIP